MKVQSYKSSIPAVLFAGLIVITVCSIVSAKWSEPYEGYYLFRGDHPQDSNPGWHEDTQGITHDDDNWYITQGIDNTDWRCKIGLGLPSHQGILWKIPVSYDLNTVSTSDPGVIRNISWDVQPLNTEGYWHYGAPCYYKFGETGYILIPTGYPSILAVFKAQDLSYVGYSTYEEPATHENIDPGWCAVDPNDPSGSVYVSGDSPSYYHKYHLQGDRLSENIVLLDYQDSIPFLNADGNQITLDHMQGGDISESGRLFYISSGFYDQNYLYGGIAVFDRQTNRMVAHSSIEEDPFNYAFTAGGGYNEEPEGLTIWDLDNKPHGFTGNAYGQLHVILVDNDCASADEVYLKHYSNTISVDADYSGSGTGRPEAPFNSLGAANTMINDFSWGSTMFGWDGARIKIKAGTYPESYSGSLVFDKQIQLFSESGTARIRSRAALSPNGIVNIGKSGEMKIY